MGYSFVAGGTGDDEDDCNSCDTLHQIQMNTNFPSNVSRPSSGTTPAGVRQNKEGDEEFQEVTGSPLGFNDLGNSTWAFLHTMAAYYPNNPTEERQQQMRSFFTALSYVYPCKFCADDLKSELNDSPPQVQNQKEFSLWLCNLHNNVNRKLGKPLFPCEFVDKRWKGEKLY